MGKPNREKPGDHLPDGAAPRGWAALACGGAAGAAFMAGWLVAASGPLPERCGAALAFGLLAGLTAWLLVDCLIGWPARFGPEKYPDWAAEARQACLIEPDAAGENERRAAADPYREWAALWKEELNRRLRVRFLAAGWVAVCGSLVALVQLTPARARDEGALSLTWPAGVGLLLTAAGAGAVLLRSSAWDARFDAWAAWAGTVQTNEEANTNGRTGEKEQEEETPNGNKSPDKTKAEGDRPPDAEKPPEKTPEKPKGPEEKPPEKAASGEYPPKKDGPADGGGPGTGTDEADPLGETDSSKGPREEPGPGKSEEKPAEKEPPRKLSETMPPDLGEFLG